MSTGENRATRSTHSAALSSWPGRDHPLRWSKSFPVWRKTTGTATRSSKRADLHQAGHHREAIRILENALAIDNRCIDAWGHLGLVAFNTRGPGPAAELYQTGIAVAEASLPAEFGGVLPWGWIDNRPFLRCLHGLALCAWRQRRWDDADAMFTARGWLDPSGAFSDLACLDAVRSRQRWTKE